MSPYVFIIAGGSGTRLWPLSQNKYPKQLLSLLSKKSLLQETLDRAMFITVRNKIFIGTNKKLKKIIQKEIPYLKSKQFIIEPESQNTAPIIAYFCAWLRNKKKDIKTPVVVLAADHFISPCADWENSIRSVFPFLESSIFCMGIQPTRPDIGYGYIETDKQVKNNKKQHSRVIAFHEKPNKKMAKQHVQNSNFYWNSGMFIFSVDLFLKELNIHVPDIYTLAIKCAQNKKALKKNFYKMPNISIDYALMEKTKKLSVVIGNFSWDDVGSFSSLSRIREKDKFGNVIDSKLDIHSVNAKNNLVFMEHNKLKIGLLGVKNLVIIQKGNILLIADKESTDNIKDIRKKFTDDN